MELSERKRKILSAVISQNVKNAEPVSSKEIQEEYNLDISSATIRNELMALEEMGLLSQPHTSSGRVPTVEGFKMYINELMPQTALSKKDILNLKKNFSCKMVEMEDVVKKTAQTISTATNLPSVVMMGIDKDAIVNSIKIVKLTENSALVIVVTSSDIIKDIIMQGLDDVSEDAIKDASKMLTNIFAGKPLYEIEKSNNIIEREFTKLSKMFSMVLAVIEAKEKENTYAVEGRTKLFEHPEFCDSKKAQSTLALIEDHDKLFPMLSDDGNLEISIKIGGDEQTKDCSVITATCSLNGKSKCTASVIGPVRMDYPKVISVLKGVQDILKDLE